MSAYTATATRQAWQRVAVCDDVSVTYDWSAESGTVLLCRAMRKAHKPDGEMLFEDDTGYRLHIASIHQWADHQPTYQGRFYRARDGFSTSWQQADGVRVEPAHYEHGLVKLCRALRDAGKPDGDLLMVEVNLGPLRYYIASIHRYAEYRLISEADLKANQDNRTASEEPTEPVDRPAPVKPIGVKQISDDWYRLLAALKRRDTALWETAHHLTKAALIANGYVEGRAITGAGEKAIATYENPPSYRDMTPAELIEIAATIGLKPNGDATHLVETLIAIEQAIAARSLAEVETMATRCGVAVRYGKGKKGEPLKKRLNLVAMANAGHRID